MTCKLVRDIKHNCEYNSGGIHQIFLLDIEDFKTYVFQKDGLYDSCFVERIRIKRTGYVELDILNESNFTETQDNGIFKQQLTTVIRTLQAEKTNSLLIASKRKYLVIFSSYSGRMFSFGSDGGSVVSFSQTSGTLGESEVYSLSIDKNSIYLLFEIDKNAMRVYLLGTEDKSNFITSEDLTNLFEIDGYEHK